MCGRTRASLSDRQVARAAGTNRWVERERYVPSYNVSPGAATPVVRVASDGGVEVHTMRWGLVPSFTKQNEKPDFYRMFNARSESVAEKNAFKRLLPSRRCLVLVNAFFEWQKEKDGKQPYHIYLAPGKGASAGGSSQAEREQAGGEQPAVKQEGVEGEQATAEEEEEEEEEPLVFAGLWDVWHGPDGPMHTYTILTTDSSKRLAWLHDRMPVILRTKEAQHAWLHGGEGSLGKLLQLCAPYNGDDLIWHPVTRQMNVASFQGPECAKEVVKPKKADFFKPRQSSKAAKADPGEQTQQHQHQQEPAAALNADEQPADRQQAAAAAEAGAQAAAADASQADEAGAGPSQSTPVKQQQQQQQQGAAPGPKSPASASQKRKAPSGGGGGGSAKKKGGSSSGKKAAKPPPPGQPSILNFFGKPA